uniref:NYN domain-containing protein n=1 Tax=Noccaea caerulescens TaxID=107243 RepID=A0A1J3H605_NOCCA
MDLTDSRYSTEFNGPSDKDYGVRVFWDLNRADLERKEQAKTIFNQITSALRKADPRFRICMLTIYGDFSLYGGDPESLFLREYFPREIVLVLKHIPERAAYCRDNPDCKKEKPKDKDDLPHHVLKQDINIHTLANNPPFNILIITSDPDFTHVIKKLHKQGYVMMLACRGDAEPSLGKYAYYKWKWQSMMEGGEPVSAATHYYP